MDKRNNKEYVSPEIVEMQVNEESALATSPPGIKDEYADRGEPVLSKRRYIWDDDIDEDDEDSLCSTLPRNREDLTW